MSQSLDKVPTNTYKQTQDLRKLSIFLLIINRVKKEEEENVTYYKTSSYTLTQNTQSQTHFFPSYFILFKRKQTNKQKNENFNRIVVLAYFCSRDGEEVEEESNPRLNLLKL